MLELDLDIARKGRPVIQSVYYPGLMNNRIKKSQTPLQPLYEAFSNSWESVIDEDYKFCIELYHNKSKNIFGDEFTFSSIQIIDYGEGFTMESFERFSRLFDNTKNKNNLGTGRVQFLHSFRYTQIESIYTENDGKKYRRRILLSIDLEKNYKSIICTIDPELVSDQKPIKTTIAFFQPLVEDDLKKFNVITCQDIKECILKRYLNKLCIERDSFEQISINHFVNGMSDEANSIIITSNDIPTPDFTETVEVPYSVYDEKSNNILTTSRKEKFEIKGFKLPSTILQKNEVRLTSKGEAFSVPGCDFSLITSSPRIETNISMLFLISSEYLTNRDTDVRGNLNLCTKSDFIEHRHLFSGREEVLIDDIETITEDQIIFHYPEFKKTRDEAVSSMTELAEMFSITLESFNKAGVKRTDAPSVMLRKVYSIEASKKAEGDAKIKSIVDSITQLNPNDKRYRSQLEKKIEELNDILPYSVREELSKYIGRRTLVLSLMEKAIDKKLDIQLEDDKSPKKKKKKKRKNQPEAILHNLLFPKHSTSPLESNLWMLNDEYIHFEGLSEIALDEVFIGDKKLMKKEEDLSQEELNYKIRQQASIDVGLRRPDVLLFPEEGRCIIIEFKAPGVDVSKHLYQINQYASIIHNLSNDCFRFTAFYGYLIGENDDIYSILDSDGSFKQSHSLGYAVRPHLDLPDLFGKGTPSLYTEIINYSDLLKRAKLRNKILTDNIIHL